MRNFEVQCLRGYWPNFTQLSKISFGIDAFLQVAALVSVHF